MKPTTAAVTTTFRFEAGPTCTPSQPGPRLLGLKKLVLGSVLAVMAGCASCDEPAENPAAAPAAIELGPVPAPAGLAAELSIRAPDATWKTVRELVGGPARLLPASFPLLAATWLGLGTDAAGALDPDAPLVGALVQSAGASTLQPVIGIRARRGPSLLAALTTGHTGRWKAERDAKSGLSFLIPKAGKASADVALALVGDYLLAAPDRQTLVAGGPYVGRTLARRKAPSEPIVLLAERAMLRGPISGFIKRAWTEREQFLRDSARKNREQHGGRVPDFADPEAIVGGLASTVGSITSVLDSLSQARLVVTPRGDRLDAALELVAEPGGAAHELFRDTPRGDLAPLLALPGDSQLAIAARSTKASREQSATSIAQGLSSVLGDRLRKAERDRAAETLLALSRGRGDDAGYALVPAGVVVRWSVADRALVERGIEGVVDSLKVRALREPLESLVGPLSVTRKQTRIEGVAEGAGVATFSVRSARALELVWLFREGSLFAALGFDARTALVTLLGAAGGAQPALARDPRLRSAASRMGDATSFAALVDPALMDVVDGPVPGEGYALVAFGSDGLRGRLLMELSKPAVQALTAKLEPSARR